MLKDRSAAELGRMMARREVSAAEVTNTFLARSESLGRELGAFLTIDSDTALRWAEHAQFLIDSGTAGPLTGVPIALKDNLCTQEMATTCASKILEGYVPPYNAHVVKRAREEGLVLLGKTNMDEFAMGTSNENSAHFPARNPWDHERVPGGSSGGSAAAVASGCVPLALGSDTGGSIRQPASLCGVVGFKPTYGRVSRYGLVAFASSLDQVGPFGMTVEDVAYAAEAISGHDPRDSTSLPGSRIDGSSVKNGSLKGKKIGLPKEMFSSSLDPGVLDCLNEAIEHLRREGAEFTEIQTPTVPHGVTTYYIIAPAEASSNLARFDGVRYGPTVEGEGHIGQIAATRGKLFGHEVKSRIMMGTYALSAGYYDAYYVRAQQVRALMCQEFDQAFQELDAVLSPTSPVVAFKLGELSKDPMALKLLDYCTIPANMGGYPAISICCGLSAGLPVGLQLMGPVMSDEGILQLAYACEQALPESPRAKIA